MPRPKSSTPQLLETTISSREPFSAQRRDRALRDPAQPEAADDQRRAVLDVRDRLRKRVDDLALAHSRGSPVRSRTRAADAGPATIAPSRRANTQGVTAQRASTARRAAPRLRRMPGIDGLRAIAVAAVFLYHAGVSWMPGGFFGVDVFFVISGYLITSLLIAELDADRHGQAAALLGRPRAAPAAGAVPAARGLPAGRRDDRARQARRAARRRAGIDLLRRQLALHLRARELLRPVRPPAAAAPPLVAGGRGAVLPRLAAAVPVGDAAAPARGSCRCSSASRRSARRR